MRFPHTRIHFTSLGLLLAASTAAVAAPVTTMQVHQAAKTWLQRTPAPLKTPLGTDITGIETHTDSDGRVLFHEVRLAPEGFVIVAPDDLLEPVIAFSSHGVLEKSSESHLFMLLQRDLRARLNQVVAAPSAKTPRLLQTSTRESKTRWQTLMGTTGSASTMSVSTIDDVRVAPLVQSTWDQAKVGGSNLYNYFTPNHYVCGCVATAMAQLMRFHEYPTTGIGALSFKIYKDKVATNATTRGGDGLGGAYTWTSMPLVPVGSTPDAERQMIGSLCYDAGLSVHMSYASDGSGSNMYSATDALRTTFKYVNAIHGYNGGELTGSGLTEMVQPNLDAGYPVLFGITGDGGHAIVCDGYGYTSATTYHHLNMGWSGSDDAWYNLPNIGTFANFYLIDDCVYNVFPSGTGEILSGRVTNAGSPVAGVTVTDGTLTATTNANGIYALKGLTAGTKTLTATKTGLTFPQAVKIVGTSQDGPTVGNVWGVDLAQGSGATPTILPQPLSQDVKLGGSVTFVAGATGIGPLQFQWTKNGVAVGTNSPTYTLAAAADSDDQAPIVVHVNGAQGSIDSAPATLSVVRLFNGDFEKGNQNWTLFNDGVVLGPSSYAEVTPHGGSGWLCIGDWSAPCTDFAMQEIVVPDASQVDLNFWVGIANKTSTPGTAANTFAVKILDSNGNTLRELQTLNNLDAQVDGSNKVIWKSYGPFSLTDWKGQAVTLRIESTQPGATDTGTIFAVDDVTLAITKGVKASLAQGALVIPTGGQTSFAATISGSPADNRVNWSVDAGGGTFNPVQTIGDGNASTTFTGGSTAGSFAVHATPLEPNGIPASSTITLVDPSSVNLTVTPNATTVLLNAPVTFTAAVTPLTDTSVTWDKSGGTFGTQTSTTTVWSSSTPGPFTITATSAVATGRSNSATITVLDPASISLSVDHPTATLASGATQVLVGTTSFGTINWTLPAGQGSLSASSTDSGISNTYTAPAGLMHDLTATVTLTNSVSSAATTTSTLTVKTFNVNGDSALDLQDILALAMDWGTTATRSQLSGGTAPVGNADLALLLTSLGF